MFVITIPLVHQLNKMMKFAALCALPLLAVAQLPEKCNMDKYPTTYPPTMQNMTMPHYNINLDLHPEERWKEISTTYKTGIHTLVNTFLNHSVGGPNTKLGHLLKELLDIDHYRLLDKVGSEYAGEIRGIAKYADLDIGYATVFQAVYELEGLCTSIVAQDANGKIFHGRNLDFGLFSGFNWTDGEGGFPGEWELTEALRPLLFTASFQKEGITIFNSTHFAGYIGIHTGSKGGVFGLSVDSRFDNNFDEYLIKWATTNYSATLLTLATRDALMTATTYEEAMKHVTTFVPVGPSYIIMSGVKAGQGAVVTRSPGTGIPLDVWDLSGRLQNGSYFVLETNYDHWKKPPIFDNRRSSAIDCMENLGQANFNGLEDLWKVLSAGPNLNRLTTFTWLLDPLTGETVSYKRRCIGVHGGKGVPGSGTWKYGCAIW